MLIVSCGLSCAVNFLAALANGCNASDRAVYLATMRRTPENVPMVDTGPAGSLVLLIFVLTIGIRLMLLVLRACNSEAGVGSVFRSIAVLSLVQIVATILFSPNPIDLPLELQVVFLLTVVVVHFGLFANKVRE